MSRPVTPIHPGTTLYEDFMKPFGLSANRLGGMLGIPANRISEIVRARRSITADTALRLGRAFGTTPEFWLNLQNRYDLDTASAAAGSNIDSIGPVAA